MQALKKEQIAAIMAQIRTVSFGEWAPITQIERILKGEQPVHGVDRPPYAFAVGEVFTDEELKARGLPYPHRYTR